MGNNSITYDGTFDGGKHTVSNLAISSSGPWAGFFGYVGENGAVKNLGVENVSIIGASRAGSIAAENAGEITACWSECSATGRNIVGGIAGTNQGSITECYFTGDVAASDSTGYAGGIAGNNSSYISNTGTITACFWSGTVKEGNDDKEEQGVGTGTTSGEKVDVTEVTGEGEATWSNAMTAMNGELSGKGWQYEKNGSSSTEPLTLKET